MTAILKMLGVASVAATASCISSILIVMSKNLHGKHSLDHDLFGVQKFHTTPVPRIGGIAVMIGMIFALIYLAIFDPILGRAVQINNITKILFAAFPIFFAGTLEDLTKKVSVKARLGASTLSALLVIFLLGLSLTKIDIWGFDTLLALAPIAIIVTTFVVVGGVNAVNIIDGFHGVAASAVVIMSAALGFIAWQCSDMFVTQLALLAAGSAFGFLLVNYPTGRLFVGDGGAYLLGFLVSETAVLLLIRNPIINAWQVLAICGYPVIEVLYSIYRRKIIRKASAGQADCLHLHTLIYRRMVYQLLANNKNQPWIRNASVACFVAIWIAGAAYAALLVGYNIPGAAAVVLAQVVLYMVTYARIVRGHWRPTVRPTVSLLISTNIELQ